MRLKDFFVPHEGNGYRPHLARTLGFGIALFLFCALAIGAFSYRIAFYHSAFLASVLPGVLVDLANQDRADLALASLEVSPELTKAAQLKANDMAAKGYFAHVSPDGTTPWYWFAQAGYSFVYAGENLAIDFGDSSAVNAAWMNSPAHRANILGAHYTEIGIAVAVGTYEGRTTTFVVQEFGSPATASSTATKAPLSVAEPSAAPAPASAPQEAPTPSVAAAQAGAPESALANPPRQEQVVEPVFEAKAPAVAGAPVALDAESYVAVKGIAAEPAPRAPLEAKAASAWYDRLLTSPSLLLELAYLVAGLIVLTAVVGVAAVPHERRAGHMLRLGVLLVALFALYGATEYFFLSRLIVK